MKQIGILFQPEMARANVEGRKWMTRRLRKLQQINADPDKWHLWQPRISEETGEWAFTTNAQQGEKGEIVRIKCPYGKAGDMMWQRETFVLESNWNIDSEENYPPPFSDGRPINRIVDDPLWGDWWEQAHYKATDPEPELSIAGLEEPGVRWKPSIHMPRWASRFVRPIVRIRCERIQSISPDDCLAEGIAYETCDPQGAHQYWREEAYRQYCELWHAINGAESWERNYWVWVVEYAKQEAMKV